MRDVLSRRDLLGLAAVGSAGLLAVACSPSTAPAAPGALVAAPWPQRPVVTLAFDVAPDLRSVVGQETLVFTPDQPIDELVFRAWPNTPAGARAGTGLVVTDAAVDDVPVTPTVRPGGAPSGAPGTLVELPLPRGPVPAGRSVRVALGFRLTLGAETGERTGCSPSTRTAWWGTAYPLLAWVRGRGWVRDDAVDLAGETVTSEAFRLADLRVTTDADLTVVGAGTDAGTVPAPPGRVTRRFRADAVRDVAVAVGDYDLAELAAGAVQIHVGAPRSGVRTGARVWAGEIARRMARLTDLLGPFPYPDLWATIVPTQSDGVEFPTSLQFGDRRRDAVGPLVAHELAHQWFYALVGNDQARDPWLDEAFATFAQALTADQIDQYRLDDVPGRDRGLVGRPMTYWAATGTFDHYVECVYTQGAAALLAARDAVGAARFDSALRSYIDRNAHRVATPSDVVAAFAGVPDVLDALARVGALASSAVPSDATPSVTIPAADHPEGR